MEYVVLFMLQFSGAPDVPKVTIRRALSTLEDCRARISALEPAPPGRRAYCAKVRIEPYRPTGNCWRENCATVPG